MIRKFCLLLLPALVLSGLGCGWPTLKTDARVQAEGCLPAQGSGSDCLQEAARDLAGSQGRRARIWIRPLALNPTLAKGANLDRVRAQLASWGPSQRFEAPASPFETVEREEAADWILEGRLTELWVHVELFCVVPLRCYDSTMEFCLVERRSGRRLWGHHSRNSDTDSHLGDGPRPETLQRHLDFHAADAWLKLEAALKGSAPRG